MDILDVLLGGSQQTEEERQREYNWKVEFIRAAFPSESATDRAVIVVLNQIQTWANWCWENSRAGNREDGRVLSAINSILSGYSRATAEWIDQMVSQAEVRLDKFWVDELQEREGEEMLKRDMTNGAGFHEAG